MDTTESNNVDIDAELECAVCSDIFYEPVQLNCGHTFCKECLKGILKTKPQCALCKTPCLMQDQNLKVNIVLKGIIEKKYPDHIKKKETLIRAREEEHKKSTDEKTILGKELDEEEKKEFNPLLILDLNIPLKRTIFPRTSSKIQIRFKHNLNIINEVCTGRQCLALTPSQVQNDLPVVTCIYEFGNFTPTQSDPHVYNVEVKATERVVVENIKNLDLDEQVLTQWNINTTDSNTQITLQAGYGHILPDIPDLPLQILDDHVADLEEFLNQKYQNIVNSHSETNKAIFVSLLAPLNQQSQNRTRHYLVGFSLGLAALLRSSDEQKQRMFETTNTLERLVVLKTIAEKLEKTEDVHDIFDITRPHHSLFSNVGMSLLFIIGLIIGLYMIRVINKQPGGGRH